MAGVDPLGVNMRAFERESRDLGWIDGRTVVIERQSTEGQPQRATDILAEVVARRPDVILLGGARWLHEAALRATRTIPIVAPFGEDPVPAGLISSLARPGGNLTGVTRATGPEFYGKASQFLRDAAPDIRRLAFLAPRETLDAFQAVAPSVNITVIPVQVDTSEQLDASFRVTSCANGLTQCRCQASNFLQHAKRIAEFAVENKLPALFGMRQSAEAGGLMSYGPSIVVLYRQMARQVDRILKGVHPRTRRLSGQLRSSS